jgi:hypothetical protein
MLQADVLLASLAGVFVGGLLMLQFLSRGPDRTEVPRRRPAAPAGPPTTIR